MSAHQSPSFVYGVAIPAYNAERTLAEAIDSVLRQTVPPSEVIVVDDGSTDGTADLAAGFGGLVRVVSQPNRGPAAATDAALAALTAPILAGLDADDLWRPEKAERQLQALAGNPDLDAVFCRAGIFRHGDAPGATIRSQDLWGRSAMMMRRPAADRIGPVQAVDGSRTVGEMIRWLDLGRRLGLRFEMMPHILADRRIIPGSLSYDRNGHGLVTMLRASLHERRRHVR